MSKPTITLSAVRASMALSEASVSWCPLCEVTGTHCGGLYTIRRQIFRHAFDLNRSLMNVDRLAECIRVRGK